MSLNKPSCYDTKMYISKGTLLIANTNEFDLTEGRVYVATKNQGETTFADCIFVLNNKGIEEDYSPEYFCLYEGEIVRQ